MGTIGCVQHDCHDCKKRDGETDHVAAEAITVRQMIEAAYTATGSPQGHAINQSFVYGAKWALSQEPTPSASTDEMALEAATEIAEAIGQISVQIKARIQCVVQRAIEAGQPARKVNDPHTDRKANEIMARGYQLTGYVLRRPETMQRVIIESSAVRWAQAEDMYEIMFPQNRQPREALTDERIDQIADQTLMAGAHGCVFGAVEFARAIEAEINGVKA